MMQRTISYLFKALPTSGILLSAGLLAAACNHAPPATVDTDADSYEEISGDEYSFKGAGKIDNLAVSELAVYQSDWQYVNKLVPPNTTVTLNHADERQHRFVTMRLRMAGKTRESSPELYKMLDDLRSEHLARGLKPGVLASIQQGSPSNLSSTQGRENQHFLASTNILDDTSMEVVANGSRIDPLYYGYLDSAAWDANGTPLGNMTYVEVYSNMPYKNSRSTGTTSLTSLKKYQGDSLLIEDTVQYGHREFYTAGKLERGPRFQPVSIQHPANTVGDACVSVCLNRTWTGDCDYDLTSTTTALKIPIQGSIAISPSSVNYKFDATKIAQYKAGTATDADGMPDPGGSIRVVLRTAAGGCGAVGSTIELPMRKFWNTVTSTDSTLSWNMTGANVAIFSDQCRLVEDSLELDMMIVLPWVFASNNSTGITTISVSNNPASTTAQLPCMRETNSCLAAGTMIDMADGRSQAIESIQSGDRVHTPYHQGDMALTVADTAKGFELVPMVHIEDQNGHSLLLTEMHPIHVVGRGMVLAKYLQVGDMVMTKSGESRLTRVSREKYDGTVHNLKVGSSAEIQSLGKDQTVVYANGFLVGDGQIQSKYEALELSASTHPTRIRLPSRWRKDYMNSARR